MSKNSKNRKRIVAAKERNRTKGYKGPARTTKTNTKKKAWYQLKDPVSGILLVLLSKEKQAELKGKGKGKKRRKDDNDE